MVKSGFPTRTDSQAIGELGLNIVSTIVREQLCWDFRRTPQESDCGIDGYIDIVTNRGYVTGKYLGVQIKTGRSYLKKKGPDAWLYRGALKHINYYLNSPVPVILLLVDPKKKHVWWRDFSAYETSRSGDKWTITIPLSNRLDVGSKKVLQHLAGASTDYLPHLDQHWSLSENIKEAGLLLIQVNRFEIESCNVRPFERLFERLSHSKETIDKARNKVDFLIDGYNEDNRDLFEIPEVKTWIEAATNRVKYLAYFLTLGDMAQGIATIIATLGDAEREDPVHMASYLPNIKIVHGTIKL